MTGQYSYGTCKTEVKNEDEINGTMFFVLISVLPNMKIKT